jgi:hypothetical protein
VLLERADLRTELPVDFGGRGGERLGVGVEQLADPGQRDAGLGQGADPDRTTAAAWYVR